jgi:Flp pilus assembly protein TadD
VLAFGLALAIGCGGARTPARPSAATRAAVERADRHERARRHDLARADYEAAIAAAPDDASAAYARREYASALIFWGELPAARAQLETCVRLAPGDAPAWHDLGLLLHQAGDDAAAVAALREARRLRPRDPRPRVALAALLWQTGDRAGAEVEYRALLALELPERVRRKVAWAIEQLSVRPQQP